MRYEDAARTTGKVDLEKWDQSFQEHYSVATVICDKLEQKVSGRIITHASITARPFFEKRGYKIIRE